VITASIIRAIMEAVRTSETSVNIVLDQKTLNFILASVRT